MDFFGTTDIKYYVKKYFFKKKEIYKNKICIDIPAGNGFASEILHEAGARVEAYDLFPEIFKFDKLTCKNADLSQKLPIESNHADYVICQEGIEHISDLYNIFKEFNRITIKNGIVYLTTPNYSNIKSRLSYFFSECEYFYKDLAPNEIESIWFSSGNKSKIYFGHLFLTGILKIRVLARLNGFKIKKIISTRADYTSLFLFPFFYPFILIVNLIAYFKSLKKSKNISFKKIYKEIFDLTVNPKILTDCHLFVELEKISELDETLSELNNIYNNFQEIIT